MVTEMYAESNISMNPLAAPSVSILKPVRNLAIDLFLIDINEISHLVWL